MEEMNELTAEERARILQHELEAVYGSSSYKIGRAVTWLPRHAKKALAYLAHNGPAISAKYLYTYAKYHKVANKDYAYWACLQKKDYPEALKKWFLETNYTHTPLDLEHPKSFSEKTQWLKLYGGFEDVYPLVDKYAVREWVKEKIGEEYLIPLLGVWDRFDDIDFDKLPDKFMLKVNHGAGWNIAVQDKSKFDKADAKRKIESWLKLNYCYLMGGLDVQYIHIKPRIIAEKFIENDGGDLYDYKIFCFNGEPKIILHIEERYTDKEERMFFLDTDWNQLPFNINVPLELDADLPRPANLEKMLDIARTLSQGYTAVRVDLYSLNDGSIKFGEMTFTTESGISRWHPESANDFMGSLIHLPGVDDAPAGGQRVTPAVSVIVPVYKAEATLDACVESILAQTFPDFELLLIDDESPDRCPEMCDAWAKKDPRIRVLHPAKAGPGPSGARNAGVQAAAAPWLTMVDSDDTIAPDLVEKLLAGAETTGAELVICNGCPVTEDGARHPLPADEQFTKDTLLDVDAFWDAFHTPWINQFTGTAHRLYAARLFDGVRYPVGLLHEDYYVLPDLIAHCSAVYCMAFTGYYVLRHAGSITDGARHEVRLAMTKGDIHRAEYFLRNGWYDRAEGALTDAALFLHDNKRAYDLTKPGHRAEFAETKRELCRVYDALAAQKGSAPMKLRAAALRAGLGVFAMYVRARG